MDLKEIISNSFKYPGSNQEHLNTNRKRWLIFGLMMLAGYLLIPMIFTAGYGLRATRKTIQGDSEMPEFNSWKEMFVDGLKVIVTSVIYYLIPALFVFVGVVSLYMGKNFMGLMFILIGIVFFIPALMLYFMAISNMANYRKLSAAFDVNEIFKRIKTIGYGRFFVWWLATMVVSVVFAACGKMVDMSSSVVGFFMVPLLFESFIALFQARSGGLIYNESLKTNENTDEELNV